MVRSSLLLVPLVAVLGVWVGRSSSGGGGYAWGVVLGSAVGGLILSLARARTRRLSTAINAWMGKTEVAPVDLRGGSEAQQFATALNALGAAYARRGLRLRDQDPRLAELIAALPEPALLFDADLTLVASNVEARQVFHASRASGDSTATTSLGSAALVDLVRTTLGGGQTRRAVARVGARTVEAVAAPVDGQVLLLARDLTESMQVEAVRRDFVANASHELKTPVAGIQSLAEALEVVLEKEPAKAADLVGRVRSEADRLASLVSDLLSLRRVDEDVSLTEVDVVDLERVAIGVVDELGPMARDVDVRVSTEVEGDPHVEAVLEDVRLVVGNLVENAIRYNRPGGSVVVRVVGHGDEVTLAVEDTGIGIPGKDLDRVFERFYRVDPGRSREAGGTGLGLSIVRHAVERNGGRVEVVSLLGRGSTFTVTFAAAGGAPHEG